MNNELQANLLQVLGSLAVLEVVDDAAEHGVGVPDPNQRHVLQMRKVGQVSDVKHWLPAGEGLDQGEHVDQVVHPGVGDLASVEGDQGELVNLHAAHHAETAEEGVADAVLAQTVEDVDLLAELLESNVGDAGVGDVDVSDGVADGMQHLLHLHQHRGSCARVTGVVPDAVAEAGAE